MSRYTTPRRCLRWEGNRHLEIVKMLAWVIRQEEHPGVESLWRRMHALCEPVMLHVTGESGITFSVLLERTRQEQGAEITPHKLMQRADKTERYGEFNEWVDAVAAAYDRVVAEATV